MFQLRLDEVQVFNRMGVESKRRLSFPSRLADIRESAWQQEQARMRQGRDRDDGWRRIQVCVVEGGSDEESGNGRSARGSRTGDRVASNQLQERGRSYKNHQRRPSSSTLLEQRMSSGLSFHQGQRSAYREHGMTEPPALFSYHNVQKKSCLVEESEESETEEEDFCEEEKEELFESGDEESEGSRQEEDDELGEEEIVEEASWGSGRRKKMSPVSPVSPVSPGSPVSPVRKMS